MTSNTSLMWDIARACMFLGASTCVLWAAHRAAHRAANEALDRLLVTAVYALVIIAAIVAAAGAVGLLSRWMLLASALTLCLASARPRHRTMHRSSRSPSRVGGIVLFPLLAAGAGLMAVMLPGMIRAPAAWDAMTYHLYFPSRWLDEGAIHHVPTVFGDNAPAFAPHNGALLHAWSMSLLSSDALTNSTAGLAIGTVILALWSLSRSIGASPVAAAWVVGWTILLPPVLRESVTATTDAVMWAAWLLSCALAARSMRTGGSGLVAASGLALGFAAGTKTIGVALAGMLAIGFVGVLTVRRRWPHMAVYCGCAALTGAPWFVRNLLLYDNPLFPLDFSIGPVSFAGVYRTEAVRAGEFHIPDPIALVRTLAHAWGWATFLLMGLGVASLVGTSGLSFAVRDTRRGFGQAAVAGFAISWFGYYVLGVPHNTEFRFAVPALILSLCGWAVLLTHLRGRSHKVAAALYALVTLVLLPGFLLTLRRSYRGLDPQSVLVIAGAIAGSFFLLWAARRPPIRPRRLVIEAGLGIAAMVLLVVAMVRFSEANRSAEYQREGYAVWAPGYSYFAGDDVEPSTIAYTGANIPYTLVGPRLRHRVVYCNVKGEVGDGLYEFWRREPRLHAYHKPPIYRNGDVRFETWLDCLRRISADFVVVFALQGAERSYLDSDADGFPIEREWMQERPDLFTPVRTAREAAIFALASGSETR